ncbi:MAG TPA: hypothetical protein VIL65_04760 [Beijerinckiaceae bacterium]|jgi:hypothetical protein
MPALLLVVFVIAAAALNLAYYDGWRRSGPPQTLAAVTREAPPGPEGR